MYIRVECPNQDRRRCALFSPGIPRGYARQWGVGSAASIAPIGRLRVWRIDVYAFKKSLLNYIELLLHLPMRPT